MKLYISADIEGTIGVLDRCECREGEHDYEKARIYMTKEVIAAINGAKRAGASKVVIKDGHATGRNIIVDMLPEDVEIIRGWSGHPFKMMQELDETFDGVIFTGYHSGAGLGGNNLAHTINGGVIRKIKINGELASEYLINSYTAASVGVPVIFLSGDENLVEEVKSKNNGTGTVAVKRGVGGSVISLSINEGLKAIEDGVEKSVSRVNEIKISTLPEEFNIEIEYMSEVQAVRGSYYPGFKKTGVMTIEATFKNYFDVLRALLFLTRA
nr:M55 family metallopeptidase [uncultured Cetobacterium sp.]